MDGWIDGWMDGWMDYFLFMLMYALSVHLYLHIHSIMEAFAGKLFSDLSGPHRPFATSDCAFILSFSIIMLHTDLHNSQIPQSKKMTKLEFVRNNRGINADKDLPTAYLEALYDEVKATQIQVVDR